MLHNAGEKADSLIAESQELEDWVGSSYEESFEEAEEAEEAEENEENEGEKKNKGKLQGKANPKEMGYQNSFQLANRIVFYKGKRAIVTDLEYNILG